MNNHMLRNIWVISIMLFFGALFSLFNAEKHIRDSLQGNLIFANEHGDIPEIIKMEIETPQNKLTLQKDDSSWRVIEADSYYASFSKIQMLLENIENARLGKLVTLPSSEIIWKNIRIFNLQDEEINSIMIGKAINQNAYYIRRLNNSEIYFSTWKMNLPDDIYSWTKQPLLDFSPQDIQRLTIEKEAISRQEKGMAFYKEQNQKLYQQQDYLRVFDILTDLHYEKVLSSQEFSPEAYPYRRVMSLTTFEGLITTITIYTNQTEYWAQVKLSATRLPRNKTNQYIERNNYLYEDWWFQLDEDDGAGLFNFRF